MKGIYSLMEKNWPTYALMSAITYIEEMSKPTMHIQIKRYKNKKYICKCFHSTRLKMNNEEVVTKFFDITKKWEKLKRVNLIGQSFTSPRKEKYSSQDLFYLSPVWLNEILATCGKIPNKYSFETALKRINNLKQYSKSPVDSRKKLFSLLASNEKLAAGAFVVSMDLECRGIESGKVSLCMSKKYKDFLKMMLGVASKWQWTSTEKLTKVDVSYSRNLGINASDQYEFGISINALKRIYELAGPLADSFKDKCVRFHINRSNNYVNLGQVLHKLKTKEKIFDELSNSNVPMSSTDLMFVAGVRTDVVLDHLHSLERAGKVIKKRSGKKYLWAIKNAN